MSGGRAGYDEGYEDNNIQWINWRGAVKSSIRGKRGQAFLRELAAAMDAMPIKRLIDRDLERTCRDRISISHWGMHECEIQSFCTLGVVGKARGLDMDRIDVDDYHSIHTPFGIANAMAREIEYVNDDGGYGETPEERFLRVRLWVERQLRPITTDDVTG